MQALLLHQKVVVHYNLRFCVLPSADTVKVCRKRELRNPMQCYLFCCLLLSAWLTELSNFSATTSVVAQQISSLLHNRCSLAYQCQQQWRWYLAMQGSILGYFYDMNVDKVSSCIYWNIVILLPQKSKLGILKCRGIFTNKIVDTDNCL